MTDKTNLALFDSFEKHRLIFYGEQTSFITDAPQQLKRLQNFLLKTLQMNTIQDESFFSEAIRYAERESDDEQGTTMADKPGLDPINEKISY